MDEISWGKAIIQGYLMYEYNRNRIGVGLILGVRPQLHKKEKIANE